MSRSPEDRVLSRQEARARLDWASGRLRSRWLWPEVEVADWVAALRVFENVARQILGYGRAAECLETNPQAAGIAAYTSGMGPLLGYWLEKGRLTATPEIAIMLARHLDHNRRRMEFMRNQAVRLVEAAAGRDVRVTILKGMQTAYVYFPEPGTRPMSDIDVLVDREQRSAAREVMLSLGFVAGPECHRPDGQIWRLPDVRQEPMTLKYVHRHDPWSVDLQFSLNRQCAPGAPLLALDDCGLMDGTGAWTVSSAARQLRPTQLLFHLLVHASCGLQSLTLLRICELVLVVRQISAEEGVDWRGVETFARRAGALGTIFPALRMTEMLAPGVIDQPLLEASAGAAPRSVTRRIAVLAPATAQRVVRASLTERFMWTSSPLQIVRHLWEYVVAPHMSRTQRWALYAHRFRRLRRMAGSS